MSLAYLVGFFYKNRENIEVAFALDTKSLLAIIGLQPILYLLQSWRFRIVMEKCTGTKVPFGPWFKIYILARFLNTVFSQTGNVYRGITLKKQYNITYTNYIGGHTSMVWLDTSMNLLMALIVIVLFQPDFQIGRFVAWKIIAIIMIIVIGLPVLAEKWLGILSFQNKTLVWIHQRFQQVVSTTVNNFKDRIYLGKLFILGLLLFARTCVAFYIYFLCFGTKVDLPALAVFYAIFKLGNFIMLTPGNLGIQELVFGFLSENMGIGMAQGILVSTLTRVIGTSFLLVLGLIFGGHDLLRHRNEFRYNNEAEK